MLKEVVFLEWLGFVIESLYHSVMHGCWRITQRITCELSGVVAVDQSILLLSLCDIRVSHCRLARLYEVYIWEKVTFGWKV